MEEIKPKKERKFLKAMGDIALVLFRELVLGIGKKVINKVGNKRQGLVIAFALVAGISYASIDSIPYPITGNKQRLGWQTSGNGLVYRGRAADTITKPSSYVDKNVKAYLLVDSVLGTIFVWRQTYWDSIKVNTRLMPFDSITFNTAKNGTVGVGEVEYNDTQGSLIQGLKGGNVTNVIGQQLHQRVNNRTGAPLAKGDVVYLAGSQGNRITVAKGLAVTDAFSANTFGVVAESIADNASGFIITEGLITGLNTSSLTEDSAVYLSPTIAGALTSTKPQAPQHSVYIGVCVKSNNGSGELFVKIRNGQELDELHDTRITNPVTGATLYYSGGLWRDTTAALLVSDTASMLTNYLRSGTAASTYLTQSNAASTYLPLTGGTLTGGLTGTNVSLNSNLTISDIIPNNPPPIYTSVTTGPSTSATVKFGLNVNNSGSANMFLGGTQLGGGSGTNPNIFFTDTRRSYASIQGIYTGAGITSSGHIAFNTTPNDATTALTERMRIASDGAITMGGTLGVTGATTLSAPLTVNSSAVFNEGSADSDFRVESDGNANMVFVDASTDRVGIGYASPTKTLDVNGTLGVFGATNLSNTLTVDGKTILNDSVRFEGNILFKKNMGLPIVKISNADYTATTSNHTIIYTTLTADKTLTIPNASDAVGVKFVISIFDIPEGNEALTLVTPGSNLFVRTDGENSSVDIVGGYCTTIQSDGIKWYILSYAPMY